MKLQTNNAIQMLAFLFIELSLLGLSMLKSIFGSVTFYLMIGLDNNKRLTAYGKAIARNFNK